MHQTSRPLVGGACCSKEGAEEYSGSTPAPAAEQPDRAQSEEREADGFGNRRSTTGLTGLERRGEAGAVKGGHLRRGDRRSGIVEGGSERIDVVVVDHPVVSEVAA